MTYYTLASPLDTSSLLHGPNAKTKRRESPTLKSELLSDAYVDKVYRSLRNGWSSVRQEDLKACCSPNRNTRIGTSMGDIAWLGQRYSRPAHSTLLDISSRACRMRWSERPWPLCRDSAFQRSRMVCKHTSGAGAIERNGPKLTFQLQANQFVRIWTQSS